MGKSGLAEIARLADQASSQYQPDRPHAIAPSLAGGLTATRALIARGRSASALLDALPKPLRKALAPLDDLAAELAVHLRPFDGAMLPALERAIFASRGERVPRDAWDLRAIPAYLATSFRVVDERDKVWVSDFGGNAVFCFHPDGERFERFGFPREAASVRQILGRPGEVWLPESGTEHISMIRTAT